MSRAGLINMKWLIAILIILFASLQYRLWVGEGSLAHQAALEKQIEQQKAENNRLRERNAVLAREVDDLKSGLEAIEERAREQMGMIKEGETFFMLVKPEDKDKLQKKDKSQQNIESSQNPSPLVNPSTQ